MAQYDTVIKNGMIIDGTRLPRFRGDIGIKDGKIAKIGRIKELDGAKVIDAEGLIVAPGFVDLHTHYDAQLFWDPYCSISCWHGVTSVVIGNCGFGFAPVKPEERERSMLTMTRNEAIPLESMQEGMPWDWVTFPEFLDSVERTPKAMNILPLVPLNPLMVWVMGLEEAKTGRRMTPAESEAACKILHEAMDAGACGWSIQRTGSHSTQTDYDGTPMATDLMDNEDILAFGRVLGDRSEGVIQMTYNGDSGLDTEHPDQLLVEKFYEELVEASGRPILFNAVAANDKHPGRHRHVLRWLESCRDRGMNIHGQAITGELEFTFTFKDWNLFDSLPAWKEACTGTVEEKLKKFADPKRRPELRAPGGTLLTGWDDVVITSVKTPELKKYENMSVVEAGKLGGKDPVDMMLDIAVADDLDTDFTLLPNNRNPQYLKEIAEHELVLFGISDGGAHTKFYTGGAYPTEILTHIRDTKLMSLEAAHWKLSAQPALAAGFKDRGMLREGLPADIIIYDLDKLAMRPVEVAHDLPAGEWRRVRRADGYRKVLINGVVTLEDGEKTGAMPGKLLRHGA